MTLIEKVTRAIIEPTWASFDPEWAAKNAIKVVLREIIEREKLVPWSIEEIATENGIDLNG